MPSRKERIASARIDGLAAAYAQMPWLSRDLALGEIAAVLADFQADVHPAILNDAASVYVDGDQLHYFYEEAARLLAAAGADLDAARELHTARRRQPNPLTIVSDQANVRRSRQTGRQDDPVTTYTVLCRRSGDRWAITVPELKGMHSQAKRLERVEAVAREAISLFLGVAPDSFEVKVLVHCDVRAKRWDKGWELHVDGVGVTQTDDLADADAMVASYVTAACGLQASAIQIQPDGS